MWPPHLCHHFAPILARICHDAGLHPRPKEFPMIGLVRAAVLSATLALGLVSGLVSAEAADKAFKRDDLTDAAIKLEPQIKAEAGPVNKPVAALRNDADAALRRGDVRGTL